MRNKRFKAKLLIGVAIIALMVFEPPMRLELPRHHEIEFPQTFATISRMSDLTELPRAPHRDESNYPANSVRDNIVQMATIGLSRGQVTISSGTDIVLVPV